MNVHTGYQRSVPSSFKQEDVYTCSPYMDLCKIMEPLSRVIFYPGWVGGGGGGGVAGGLIE